MICVKYTDIIIFKRWINTLSTMTHCNTSWNDDSLCRQLDHKKLILPTFRLDALILLKARASNGNVGKISFLWSSCLQRESSFHDYRSNWELSTFNNTSCCSSLNTKYYNIALFYLSDVLLDYRKFQIADGNLPTADKKFLISKFAHLSVDTTCTPI